MKEVEEITDKKEWEEFLLQFSVETTPFFQSWDWGEVQKKIGHSIYRFGLFEDGKLLGIALSVEIKARRGHYLHLRHAPVVGNYKENFDFLFDEIKSYAKKLKCDFIRVSPLFPETEEVREFFKNRGFRNAAIHNMDAENAWVLSLEESEEQILAGMRKTTRYLVKKAKTFPIEVSSSSSEADFKAFMDLYNETSRRHGFVPHRGLSEEFKVFTKEKEAILFVARFEGKVISGILIVYYGNQAVYHHGASSDMHKEVPAAYLLQWEAIREAKKQGKKIYNFWGVVPENKPNHPWRGLTLFKTGFGGNRLNFVHAQDYPLNYNYWKTHAIETITKKRKGY